MSLIYDVYFNLHKKVFSVRQKGKVVKHSPQLIMSKNKFIVQPAGRKKVLSECCKNVHAVIRGEVIWFDKMNYDYLLEDPDKVLEEISYNPYKFDHFYKKKSEEAIYEASLLALITVDGKPKVFSW